MPISPGRHEVIKAFSVKHSFSHQVLVQSGQADAGVTFLDPQPVDAFFQDEVFSPYQVQFHQRKSRRETPTNASPVELSRVADEGHLVQEPDIDKAAALGKHHA